MADILGEKSRAVLYLRLSKEDKDKLNKGDDSASIQNQRLLLTDYALRRNYRIVNVYSDDDESGLFDTRPGFERMLRDAGLGKFDMVIAKSQSRFSRNMEHIEKYLHHDFPNLGIRFIGVVDGADTADTGNKKSRQINGLVNEWYCEDLSANIRSALRAKMRDGQYLGASCPYGYVKDSCRRNHLVIDAYAAGVVRRIYRLYLKGYGKAKIGRILTEEGILIPTLYKREILGIRYHNPQEMETTKGWSYQTIHTILNNEVYTGNVVQNKYSNLSYKDKKHVKQPEESWIRVTGTHEAIIDSDTFEEVQRRQRIRMKEVKCDRNGSGERDAAVFSGFLFCADCGHAMVRTYERRGEHKFTGYCCKTYKTQGKKVCTSHAVNNDELEAAVLKSIQLEAVKILTPEAINALRKKTVIGWKSKDCQSQICFLQKEIERREDYKKKTYKSYLDGLISEEEYKFYTKEFEADTDGLKKKLLQRERALLEQKKKASEYDEWAERFINAVGVGELTREMAFGLLERIEVNSDGSIHIFYKFRNSYAESEE